MLPSSHTHTSRSVQERGKCLNQKHTDGWYLIGYKVAVYIRHCLFVCLMWLYQVKQHDMERMQATSNFHCLLCQVRCPLQDVSVRINITFRETMKAKLYICQERRIVKTYHRLMAERILWGVQSGGWLMCLGEQLHREREGNARKTFNQRWIVSLIFSTLSVLRIATAQGTHWSTILI